MSAMGSIDVAGLVSQLMQVEHRPVDLLTMRKAAIQKTADAYDSLKKLLDDVTTKVTALDGSTDWNVLKTSSSSSTVTTAVTTGGYGGSLSFTVGALATSQAKYSTSTLASTSAKVTSVSHQLLAAGGAALGFSSMASSTDLPVGSHTVEVTQASAPAIKTGPWPSSSVNIDPLTNEMVITLNGTDYTVGLADGSNLDHQGVVDSLNAGFATAGIGGQLKASMTATGDLQLATVGEGSANSLQVKGGTALAALGLSVDAAAITGTDGKVKVDGVESVLTDVKAGGPATLSSTTGSINVSFAGGVRTGSVVTRNVDFGDGSLGAVVNAINSSGGDVSAAAIKVGEGAYRLQIQSRTTGTAGRMNFDTSVFDLAGAFATLSDGTDASITLGGANPLTITSSSNTFKDVLPGVAFTVTTPTTDPVTVTATKDSDALASKVQSLVDSVNKALKDITTKTAYDATSRIAGPLMGDSLVTRLKNDLVKSVTAAVAGGDLTQAGQVGITVARDGTLSFDKAKFSSAYAASPTAVQRMFVAPVGDTTNPGIAERVGKAVKAANNFSTGYVTMASRGRKDVVADLGKQIGHFEDRLTIRQATLTKQFTNLNDALSNLGNQQQWLAGQIAGLG